MTWLEGLITFLQVAAILSGGVFAALALFTEYKKDGNVTKYGRIAVIGIVLSALFSLGTQWGQSKLDSVQSQRADEKARQQLADESQRFRQQMGRLNSLSSNLVTLGTQNLELRTRAEQSLERLAAVQTRVGQSLSATRQIGEQDRRNTSRVLQTMWDDANRIDASSLTLVVTYQCGPVTSNEPFPLWLAENTEAIVRVASLTPGRRARLPDRTFSTQPRLSDEASAEFRSTDQRVTVTRTRSVDGDEVDQVSRFTSFASGDLKGFDGPDRWRNVAIEVLIRGFNPGLGRVTDVLDATLGDKTAMAEHYDVAGILGNDDYSATMLPCPVQVALIVNGRLIANAEGRLVQVMEWDEDVRRLAVVKFPIVAGIPNVFPSFSVTGLR